jgi:hypothetical protein
MSEDVKLPNGVRRMKAEHLSASAIALTLIMGAGGFGINLSSNAKVQESVEEIRINMQHVTDGIRASEKNQDKVEKMID